MHNPTDAHMSISSGPMTMLHGRLRVIRCPGSFGFCFSCHSSVPTTPASASLSHNSFYHGNFQRLSFCSVRELNLKNQFYRSLFIVGLVQTYHTTFARLQTPNYCNFHHIFATWTEFSHCCPEVIAWTILIHKLSENSQTDKLIEISVWFIDCNLL